MRVLGSHRVKKLGDPAQSWFRQKLLETAYGTTLPGFGYFGVTIPTGSGVLVVDALLFTPDALIVVDIRSLPWFRGGRLLATLSGPWTVEGMDAGLTRDGEHNPGDRVTKLVFALREHLRTHGVGGQLRGLVCVAGPKITVHQEKTAARLGNYQVAGADVDDIRRAMARRTATAPARRWTRMDVRGALTALHITHDIPDPIALAEQGFPVDRPMRPLPPPRRPVRHTKRPEYALAGLVLLPVMAGLGALGWAGTKVWQALPKDAAMGSMFDSSRVSDGVRFSPVDRGLGVDCGLVTTGAAKNFFAHTPCHKFEQVRFTTQVGGAEVAVSVVTAWMPDADSAGKLTAAVTAAGGTADRRGHEVILAESQFTDPSRQGELTAVNKAALTLVP